MPYRLEITAGNPVELANALTGLFSMTAVLQAQTQQRVAAAQAPKPETPAAPEPKAEEAKPARRGRAKKEDPKPVEEQLTESLAETAPEAETPAPVTKGDVSAKLIGLVNLAKAKDPDNENAGRDAAAKVFADLKMEPKLSLVPEDRYAEMAALIDERVAELEG